MPFQGPNRPALVADHFQNPFDLSLFVRSNAEQRAAWTAAVVAVEVAGVLDAGDAELADDALVGLGDALLLFRGELQVVIFPGEIDLLAGLRGEGGEGEDAAAGAGLEATEQRGPGAGEDLEADFLGAGFDGDGGRRGGQRLCLRQVAGGDERARASGLGANMRPVTASKMGVTVTVRRRRSAWRRRWRVMRSTLPLESLMPMMLGCWASSAMTSIGMS